MKSVFHIDLIINLNANRSFPMSVNEDGTMGNVTIPAGTLPILDGEEVMYVCLRSGRSGFFLHQGTTKSLQVGTMGCDRNSKIMTQL